LLARLPRRRGADVATRASRPPAALAALAGATVLATALVGLAAALLVVQTLDPTGTLSVGGCTVPAGCCCSPRAVSSGRRRARSSWRRWS